MTDPEMPNITILCPHHKQSLYWEGCTPDFVGCEVERVREATGKKGGKAKTISIPEDIAQLNVSRQRKIQIAWKRLGKCIKCGEKAINKNFCAYHAVTAREYQRRTKGWKTRNFGSKSYGEEVKLMEQVMRKNKGKLP